MEIKMSLDRIENEIAVMLVRPEENMKVEWPLSMLPKNAQEGDVITFTLEIDQEETTRSKEKVSGLLNKLLNKDNSKK